MEYKIARWSSQFMPKADEFHHIKKLDSAMSKLWGEIYAMLAGAGKLDTARGWKLRADFLEFEKECKAGLRRGYYREKTFYLSEKEKGFDGFVSYRQSR